MSDESDAQTDEEGAGVELKVRHTPEWRSESKLVCVCVCALVLMLSAGMLYPASSAAGQDVPSIHQVARGNRFSVTVCTVCIDCVYVDRYNLC